MSDHPRIRGATGAFALPRVNALPPTLAPRLISREASAAYINVSPNTFDAMVKAGTMPSARKLSGRRHAWDVRELDAAIDNLPVDGLDEDGSWSDIDAA